jgi:hypothetical protein
MISEIGSYAGWRMRPARRHLAHSALIPAVVTTGPHLIISALI